MKRSTIAVLAALIAFILLMGACTSPARFNDDKTFDYAQEGEAWGSVNDSDAPIRATASPKDNGDVYGGHKIIKTGSMSMETREYNDVYQFIRTRVEELGGYVYAERVYGTEPKEYGDSGRTLDITLKIPAANLETYMSDMGGKAIVTESSIASDDVTDAYFDTESRLEMYTIQRDRLMEILEKATELDDILKLESELSRLTYEIESLTGTLNKYDNLIAYSTLNVYVRELVATQTTMQDTLGTRISETFKGTLNALGEFGKALLIVLIGGFPIILIIAAIVVAVILIVKKKKKKRAQS